MNTTKIIADLRAERDRIDAAIRALEALEGTSPSPRGQGSNKATQPKGKRAPRQMSAAGRKRISEMMKKRWAERRRAAKKTA